jgi:beta-phosphoglucomutase-like phosphatase (HAD superfamily)
MGVMGLSELSEQAGELGSAEVSALTLVEGTFSALIFDCDGTLVDTAPAHLRALQIGLAALELTMTPEWYYPRGGLTPDALWDEYEAHLGVARLPRESLSERYTAAFQEGLDRLEEVTVIAEVARAWHGRVPMAVASNGRRLNVEASLRATKLLSLFDWVVAAEDVTHGKPEPDVFLEAARRMKVEPEGCIVFEDSNEGLEAAKRAGMRAIDIREFFRPER